MVNIKKIVIFGESNRINNVFYNSIKRLLITDEERLEFNKNNYLELFFRIEKNEYLLVCSSSKLFFCKNDNEIDKEEKTLNQELLLTSDMIYFIIDVDNNNLDYNLRIQKYFNQNKKKHLVIFSSSFIEKNQFEDNSLTSISIQRIIKNNKDEYYFFFLENDHFLPQIEQFIYNEFSAKSDKSNVFFDKKKTFNLTIFGPPNSGKSTLLNSLLDKKRSIVSSLAGTTCENVKSLFLWKNTSFEIKDTEGVIASKRNDLSILNNCQISWIVLDSREPITKKTLQIISLAQKCNQATIIILNKVDIATIQQISQRKKEILRLKSFSFVPIISISALKKKNLFYLLTILENLVNQSQLVFSKSLIDQQFHKLLEKNPPPTIHGKHLKIYYAIHEKGFVHKFVIFVNDPKLAHFSYHRYIVNYLRRNLIINSLPIRLFFKKS